MTRTSAKIDRWDLPTSTDLFGREPFVETILKTIESTDEGFNFGISARWGEGKSSILEQLGPRLETVGYKVLKFEPWKYTQDQISIKRKFIIDIYKQLGKEYDETELYVVSEKEVTPSIEKRFGTFLENLALAIRAIIPATLAFLFFLWLLKKFTGWNLDIESIFLSNLFIPILAGFVPLLRDAISIRVKQPIPKVESTEQFEKRFNAVIDELMHSPFKPKRVVVFVDDLDRCSHKEVEQVLTALFTFFSNKNVIYVITADHTVIRRYISEFLDIPPQLGADGQINMKATNDLKNREATEYLKKIFQINWILPRIPPDLLEDWVKKLIKETSAIEFKNPYAESYLVDLIRNNFEGNPRKIKHFLRTLSFQLEAANEKIKRVSVSNTDEKKNLALIIDCPELLAKILIIQDRFSESYEKLQTEPNLIRKYESGEFSEDAELQRLMSQEPRFFESITRTQNKTVDPYYFIYFSGSTGFIEPKTVDPSQIKTFARGADFENLVKAISGLTDEPRNRQIEHIKDELANPQIQQPEKANAARSLFYVISLIEESRVRIQKISDLIDLAKTYSQEFLGIQAVDISKIAPHLDVSIAQKLLAEEPFIQPTLRNQTWNGLFQARQSLDKKVLTLFIKILTEKLMAQDEEFQTAMGLLKQFEDEIVVQAEGVIAPGMVESFRARDISQKEQILDIAIRFKNVLAKDALNAIQNSLAELAKSGIVSHNIFVVSNIPSRIRGNFDLTPLVEALVERIRQAPTSELEQLFNNLFNQSVREALGQAHLDRLIKAFTDCASSTDSQRVNFTVSKIPELLRHSGRKKEIINNLLVSTAKSIRPENRAILSTIWANKQFWIEEPGMKKFFTGKIKSLQKSSSDDEFKTIISSVLNELTT